MSSKTEQLFEKFDVRRAKRAHQRTLGMVLTSSSVSYHTLFGDVSKASSLWSLSRRNEALCLIANVGIDSSCNAFERIIFVSTST